jgi:hypothetical protein
VGRLKLFGCTRWFKHDRDKLWLVYTQIVPVIFEPPCNPIVDFCVHADIRFYQQPSKLYYRTLPTPSKLCYSPYESEHKLEDPGKNQVIRPHEPFAAEEREGGHHSCKQSKQTAQEHKQTSTTQAFNGMTDENIVMHIRKGRRVSFCDMYCTYIYCVLFVYLLRFFCSYFAVLCYFLRFVCTSMGLLRPDESPIAVSK